AITPKTAGQPAEPDGKILVPFAVESALSGVGKSFTPNDRLWYRRTVSLPSDWTEHRILLQFGAADYDSVLWINGGIVGSHTRCSDASKFNVTEWLESGENKIIVADTDH